MGYSFDTIDGLFRPNYRVYQAFNITQQSEPKIIESELPVYKPNNLERIKSVIVETPSQQDAVEEPVQIETQEEFEDELSKNIIDEAEKMTKEADKDRSLQHHILIAGAVSFAIAIVFLVLFYQ